MAVLFEMVNHSAANDAFYVAQDFGGFAMAVRYRMQMVRHQDVSVD